MAPRINWASFGTKSNFEIMIGSEFHSNEVFTALSPLLKKKLVIDGLNYSQQLFPENSELKVKIASVIRHLEIDDKSNAYRLISELLLMIRTRSEESALREVSTFLTNIQSNL